MQRGVLEMEALTYIRGRSIPRQFIICDEAQNLSPHMIKTLITRVGEGSKIVFTGDPEQIDHPYLDACSNGLSYLVEKLKAEKIAGHVTLIKGERSKVAEMGAHLL
jgi:PhoH-like ATPase